MTTIRGWLLRGDNGRHYFRYGFQCVEYAVYKTKGQSMREKTQATTKPVRVTITIEDGKP